MFTYILLDDLMSIHEQLGAAVVDAWHAIWPRHMDEFEPWDKWHRDMGDLAVFAAVGMVPLAMAIAGVARSSRQDRTNAILLLLALSALGMFAVGADLIHGIFRYSFRGSDLLFTAIEDGGEELVLTLAVGLVVLIRRGKLRETSLVAS